MVKLGILSRDWQAYRNRIADKLPKNVDLTFATERLSSEHKVDDVDILLSDPGVLADSIDQFNKLAWVQSTWAGVTPLLNRSKKDYLLTGLKDVFGEKMSEFVFAYLLHFARNVQSFQIAQQKQQWQPPVVGTLVNKRIGILGVGSIGCHVAKTAQHFGMTVSGMSRSSRQCPNVDIYFSHHDKIAFCTDLDYVVNLLPDTVETKHFVDKEFLQLLPPRCVFINAGRGVTVDDSALMNALRSKQLSAAVLDVFVDEPLAPSHPYWQVPNVFITQHTAALSDADDITQVFLKNLMYFLDSRPLDYVVDWHQGY